MIDLSNFEDIEFDAQQGIADVCAKERTDAIAEKIMENIW